MSEAKLIKLFPAGDVALPPSKSLSHRAVICAALALADGGGESALGNLGRSQDIDATIKCVEKLFGLGASGVAGSDIQLPAQTVLRASPSEDDEHARAELAGDCISEPTVAANSFAATNTLNCNESGSTLRFLIPLAAMTGKPWRFTGQGRLMQRPLELYADVFAKSGAMFVQNNDSVLVQGPLTAGVYELPGGVSSQFISGLLLALPLAEQDSKLVLTSTLESAAYVDLTINVMAEFGITVTQDSSGNYLIFGGQHYTATNYTVEADYSQAAYFLGAGALGRSVNCTGLTQNSAQGDAAILDVLTQMGAVITWNNCCVNATANQLKAVTIDAREIPDLIPPLATLCCFAQGTSKIINAGRLRLKESDRLHAITVELQKLGADIQEAEDSLTITGQPTLDGGSVDAHNDHRIAMSMALAAIGCREPVALTGWDSVQKSYPAFWTDFEQEVLNGRHLG